MFPINLFVLIEERNPYDCRLFRLIYLDCFKEHENVIDYLYEIMFPSQKEIFQTYSLQTKVKKLEDLSNKLKLIISYMIEYQSKKFKQIRAKFMKKDKVKKNKNEEDDDENNEEDDDENNEEDDDNENNEEYDDNENNEEDENDKDSHLLRKLPLFVDLTDDVDKYQHDKNKQRDFFTLHLQRFIFKDNYIYMMIISWVYEELKEYLDDILYLLCCCCFGIDYNTKWKHSIKLIFLCDAYTAIFSLYPSNLVVRDTILDWILGAVNDMVKIESRKNANDKNDKDVFTVCKMEKDHSKKYEMDFTEECCGLVKDSLLLFLIYSKPLFRYFYEKGAFATYSSIMINLMIFKRFYFMKQTLERITMNIDDGIYERFVFFSIYHRSKYFNSKWERDDLFPTGIGMDALVRVLVVRQRGFYIKFSKKSKDFLIVLLRDWDCSDIKEFFDVVNRLKTCELELDWVSDFKKLFTMAPYEVLQTLVRHKTDLKRFFKTDEKLHCRIDELKKYFMVYEQKTMLQSKKITICP